MILLYILVILSLVMHVINYVLIYKFFNKQKNIASVYSVIDSFWDDLLDGEEK